VHLGDLAVSRDEYEALEQPEWPLEHYSRNGLNSLLRPESLLKCRFKVAFGFFPFQCTNFSIPVKSSVLPIINLETNYTPSRPLTHWPILALNRCTTKEFRPLRKFYFPPTFLSSFNQSTPSLG
ncbi:hypothetical protein AVEN_166181-1, partial [Araneus ventricosus]